MLCYLIRRILYMLPTLFGVLLVTFILFNVVGGSPAAMTLGEKVDPIDLEEFDEVRGFNKPLVFGWCATTRAFSDTDFRDGSGPWHAVGGIWQQDRDRGFLRLAANETFAIPMAFPPFTNTTYAWRITSRSEADAVWGDAVLPAQSSWNTVRLTQTSTTYRIATGDAPLDLAVVSFKRCVDNPFDSQFTHYLSQMLRGDFGVSSSTHQKVSTLLWEGLGPSLALTVPIFLINLSAALGLALLCAYFRDTWIDRFFLVTTVGLLSVNYLVWIVAGQYFLAYRWGWFPIWGFESWRYLLLPVVIGVVSGLGGNVRFYRTVMLDEMYRDYVRTAFAKGVRLRDVLLGHVLRNALIPVLTNVVVAIPFLYTGSLLLESFFGIPGLGYLGVNALNSADVDVVRAVILIGAILFMIANLLTDLLYALVDPRVTFK